MVRLWVVAVTVALLVPRVALGQGQGLGPGNQVFDPSRGFNNPRPSVHTPHPTMPWSGVANPYGQVVRYVWMPAQPVVIDAPTATDGVGLTPLVVEIPGYYVSETTVGWYYPQRWVLQQVAAGVYRWQLAPAAFVHR